MVLCSSEAWFEYGQLVLACEVALGLLKKVLDVALDLLLDELGSEHSQAGAVLQRYVPYKHR